jgi:putative ATP-binding cassette transporter
MAKPDTKPKPSEKKSSAEKSELVDVNAENGDSVEPPPPEVVEPAPEMSPEEAEQARKDYLLTRFWISARGYWGKSGDRLAWLFTIGLLILIIASVGFQYGINVWNRATFDAIEKRDSATVYYLTGVFFPLAIGSVSLGVAQVFARMGIQRRWRAWLTGAVLSRWLASGRYYQLNLVGGDHQNPEYRIAEDLRVATESPVDFVAGVTSALLSAATFIVVLWTIGRTDGDVGWPDRHHPGLPRDRRDNLRGDRLWLDHDDRATLRAGVRRKEPGRSRIPLCADPRARERRKYRAARGRAGGARRHR